MGPKEKPRAFVHTVNGSAGVAHVHELHAALQRVYGKKTPVYLLTIIDNQDDEEIDEVNVTSHPSVLFFKAPRRIWQSSDFNGLDTLAEEYTRGIARAMSLWTLHDAGETVLDNLRELGDSVVPFYANPPTSRLYNVIEGKQGLDRYVREHEEDVEEAYQCDEESCDQCGCMRF